jgi:hypothetical protein
MYKIGLDLSLSSSAITIEKDNIQYILSYLNKNKVNKWAKKLSNINNLMIKRIDYNYDKDNYSDSEIQKLILYNKISDIMISDIKKIVLNNKCDIRIEGYSYASKSSSINDIITLSTLIRLKLLKELNCTIRIIAPNSLKIETCKYAYGITEIKRFHKKTNKPLKSEFKIINNDGIAGGSFTKFEMYKSILEKKTKTIIFDFVEENKEVLNMKKIPSPIDDIIDSLMLIKIQ